MNIRQTHTFAILELSPSAYREIYEKLRAAHYTHAFIVEENGQTVIDLNGIAVISNSPEPGPVIQPEPPVQQSSGPDNPFARLGGRS